MYSGRIERLITQYSPLPICVVNTQGKVTKASSRIAEVFKYDGIVDYDIFALTGFKIADILQSAEEEKPLYIERNDRSFKVICSTIGEGETASVFMHFVDITAYERLKDLYNDEKTCLMLVNVDNYDELTANTSDDSHMSIAAEIDRFIRGWAAETESAVVRYRENLYEIVITHKTLDKYISEKFSVLDKAREIEGSADFPVTLSIGVGVGGKTLAEMDDYAQDALDLALGRGGDQAIIKNIRNFEYYGGKSQGVEKSNKGKARIIAHALLSVMSQTREIFIMGHKNPDMDCFGAALGIYRIADSMGKHPYIILGEYNETMTDIVQDTKNAGIYEFVSPEKAASMADDKSLVIVVDTHRPSILECPEILDKTEMLVVIDHHRKSEDALPNQIITYMEPYASSASELVVEMLQHVCDRREVAKMEADAMLAGIMLDTNRFAVKAGVRTFEAASWLRRAGADLQNVRRYFQANSDTFRARAAGIANARILPGGIAMSICEGENINSQIINSQVADELLTIKGIKASFVAGKNEFGRTVVSARSLGDVNVQRIMECFGGGGHLNTAGAQVDDTPEEILQKIEDFLETSHKEGNI